MAFYENGKRISGIRDFPAYTWAAYHALPVAKRPKAWKCTDRNYTEIPFEAKHTFTPTSYSAWSAYGGCYYRKRGTTVEINVALSGSAGASGTQIFTLPAGYIPTHSIGFPALSVNNSVVSAAGLYIASTGAVLVTNPSGYYIAHATFEIE